MRMIPEPNNYEPFISPLFLPVRQWRFRCRFVRPQQLPVRDGATPGTLLTGCFRSLLMALQCEESPLRGETDIERLRSSISRSEETLTGPCIGEEFTCARPATCVCGALHRLRCSWQPGRILPPVVRLSAPALWESEAVREWELVVTVLGRRPGAHAKEVRELVRVMGQVGFRISGQNAPFDVDLVEPEESGLIGNALEPGEAAPQLWLPDESRRMLLAFSTPLLLKPRKEVDSRTGAVRRLFEREGDLDLARLLGNLAFDLCALDLEDLGETAPPVSMRRALCEAARAFTEEAALEIRVLTTQFSGVDLGVRESRSGSGAFGMQGLTGFLVMKCPPALVPWVRVMSHWRAGQLGSKGFGEVQVWG